MNHFISGIIKIILLEASIGLVVLDFVAPDRFERERRIAFAFVAGFMVFAWANYGQLPNGGTWFYAIPSAFVLRLLVRLRRSALPKGLPKAALRRKMVFALGALLVSGWLWWGLRTDSLALVHPWEQYHFYLGAKYQKELGSFDLYKATLLADREGPRALTQVTMTRELETFNDLTVEKALLDGPRVRAQFDDEQWQRFKDDWTTMSRLWPIDWQRVMNDHGNSNSPAWAILAHPITLLLPLSRTNQALIGWLDMLLMLGMWWFVYETFDRKVATVGVVLWAAAPIVFDYLAGSFLRWDWIFALGMSACFIKREKWALAGGFFAFAAATKLFPVFFGIAMLIRAGFEFSKTRKFRREHVRFAVSALITGAVIVAIATAMFGVDSWVKYAQRIQVAQLEKYYSIQYSLKTVFLQFAAPGESGLVAGIFPGAIKQAMGAVEISDYGFSFLLTRVVFTVLIALIIRRTGSDVEAFMYGPLLVFTWLTVNMYYWNMLGFLAMALMLRAHARALWGLVGLHLIFMIYYLYQHLNRAGTEAYAVAFLLCGWVVLFGLIELREPKISAPLKRVAA